MSEHFVVPDTQVREGVPLEHLEAAGNYIVDKKPDTIIHLGDHWDMHSLSSYDRGTKKGEGTRYQEDITVGIQAMHTLLSPIWKYNALQAKHKNKLYKPRMVFTLGNHEERIMRYVNSNPELAGKCSYEDLELTKLGWEWYNFRVPVEIDGVYYAHYFYNPNTGRPYGGRAATRLNNIGFSFTMGHQQGKDEAEKPLANGKTLRGLIVGSFYQHEEDYKGPQGNHHWRGCIYKHEVRSGSYCMMELSLDYLLEKWL